MFLYHVIKQNLKFLMRILSQSRIIKCVVPDAKNDCLDTLKTFILQLIKSIVFVYSYPIRKDPFYEQTH